MHRARRPRQPQAAGRVLSGWPWCQHCIHCDTRSRGSASRRRSRCRCCAMPCGTCAWVRGRAEGRLLIARRRAGGPAPRADTDDMRPRAQGHQPAAAAAAPGASAGADSLAERRSCGGSTTLMRALRRCTSSPASSPATTRPEPGPRSLRAPAVPPPRTDHCSKKASKVRSARSAMSRMHWCLCSAFAKSSIKEVTIPHAYAA